MKKLIFISILLMLMVQPNFAMMDSPWFLMKVSSVEQMLSAKNPLPYLKEGFSQFLLENPTMAKFFASELNQNNGWTNDPRRQDVGERMIFGRTLNAEIAKTIEVKDEQLQAKEVIRLLFGPWYTSKAYTYSTQKNLGWFPYHQDLLTGEWYKTDPRSPDLGIRVFHYTDYDHRNTTTTFGVFIDRYCDVEEYYWCRLTIIRKTP